ncbi:MAG: hypothetical protein WAQ53_16475 [Thiofilum sp.]|uniref:hypothetical protein n=1 Tax=Thiofilum sp. TaxID=2212733 RepID=UPI0025D67142|nr:hypothetical protein [Thiofilum sp.]MBK8452445.1 hypothetical protein [Thiofilum sp.]
MNQEVITPWIEHLTNPFTLAGFALFIIAGLGWIFKPSQTEALSGASIERIVTKLIYTCLILGVLAIGLGFAKDLLRPTVQEVKGVKNSAVSVAGCQAIASQQGQAQMQGGKSTEPHQRSDQRVENIENSAVAVGNCDAAANSNTELKTGQ